MALRFIGLKQKTLRCYERALKSFFDFLDEENMKLPSRPRKLDECVAQFLEHLFLEDRPITYAGHTLSAFRRFYPQLRYQFPLARQYFSNWKSVHVTRQAVPLPAKAVFAIAGAAIACNEYSFAAILLLGFLAFLRTSELVHLKFSQLHVAASGSIVLVLPSSKTSRDKPESISVSDGRIAALLLWLKTSATTDHVWNGSVPQFRAFLARFCEFLAIQDMGFSAYSIRRGGASSAFLRGISFDQLLVTGRWQSIKTARIYLDTGRAALIQQAFSSRSTHLLARFGALASSFCTQLRQRRLA